MVTAVQITAAGLVVHHTTAKEGLEIAWVDVRWVGKACNVTKVE